MNIEQYCTW